MGEISFLRGVPAQEALEAVAGIVENNYVKALREHGAKLLQYQIPGLSDFNGFIPLKKSLADRYGIGGDPNSNMHRLAALVVHKRLFQGRDMVIRSSYLEARS